MTHRKLTELLGEAAVAKMYAANAGTQVRLLLNRPDTLEERFRVICRRAFKGDHVRAAAWVERNLGLLAHSVDKLERLPLSTLLVRRGVKEGGGEEGRGVMKKRQMMTRT
eukprot:9017618-Pyramimonas_sp.AAC.1